MRYRITFSKTDLMRFTSHLDLQRAWERTLRRAGLPLAYSQGFSPHPRINLASALPLGFSGENELLDAWLEQPLPVEEIQAALEKASPPGMQIQRVEVVDERAPALQTQVEASEYLITFLESLPDLDIHLDDLLSASSLPRSWRGKSYDLRPLVWELRRLPDDEGGCQRLYARLQAREGATARPEEVISALGADPADCHVHRQGLTFRA